MSDVMVVERTSSLLVPVSVTVTVEGASTSMGAGDVVLAALRNRELPAADTAWADPTVVGEQWGYLVPADALPGLYTVYAKVTSYTPETPIVACGKYIVR